MMTFRLDEVFSSIYRAANVIPVEGFSTRMRFGEHPSQFRGDGHDFDRMVEYDPTKHSLSQIDWRSIDSKKRLYVRESRVTKDFPVLVLGDVSTSMTFGVDNQHKERLLLEVIGDIGLAAFHSQDPMGFIGFAESAVFDEEPRIGEDNVYYVIEQVYDFFKGLRSDGRGKLNRRKTDFQHVFDLVNRKYANSHCFIAVISDFIGAESLASSQVLRDLADRHEVVFIFIDDPEEFNVGGKLGYLRVENIEKEGDRAVVLLRKMPQIGLKARQRRREFRKVLESLRIDSIVLEYGKHFSRLHRFFLARQESFRA